MSRLQTTDFRALQRAALAAPLSRADRVPAGNFRQVDPHTAIGLTVNR
jgi:hypothetical protein